jgi:hypothetical protein
VISVSPVAYPVGPLSEWRVIRTKRCPALPRSGLLNNRNPTLPAERETGAPDRHFRPVARLESYLMETLPGKSNRFHGFLPLFVCI